MDSLRVFAWDVQKLGKGQIAPFLHPVLITNTLTEQLATFQDFHPKKHHHLAWNGCVESLYFLSKSSTLGSRATALLIACLVAR